MEAVHRKGHSLKSITGGLIYFLYLGHLVWVITPAILGFHLIKTLVSIPEGVKTSRFVILHGTSAGVFFMTRRPPEAQNDNNTTAAGSRPESSISNCFSTCQSCHWCQPNGSQSDSYTQAAHPGLSLSTCRGVLPLKSPESASQSSHRQP